MAASGWAMAVRRDRRSAIRRGGLAVAATVIGVSLAPSPPSAHVATTVESADEGLETPGFDGTRLIDERESPVATYQYRRHDGGFDPTAPMNVIVEVHEEPGGLERVMAVLEDAGWVRSPQEYTRYALEYDTGEFVVQQATAAETYYGTTGRRHVRCWQFDDVVSMQAHRDTGAQPKHGIETYAETREYVGRLYEAAGWNVTPGALDLQNAEPPDHDGKATLITEGTP